MTHAHTESFGLLGLLPLAITCWLKHFPCFTLRILAFQCTANNSLEEQRQSWEKHWSWNCYRKWGHLGLTHPTHRTIHYEDSHSVMHYPPGILPQFSSLRIRCSSLVPDCSFHRRFRVLQVSIISHNRPFKCNSLLNEILATCLLIELFTDTVAILN